MDRLFRKLRLFVASPGDLQAEREGVQRVVDHINRSGGPAEAAGVVVEVLRWETHISPFMGRAEAGILEQLPVESWDVFLGILWQKFGSPPGAPPEAFGRDLFSGTEEEFELAHRSWKARGRPHILFYRCTRPPRELTELDLSQFQRVHEFFERFAPAGSTPGLYRKFLTTEEFERHLEQDLAKLLMRKPPLAPVPRGAADPSTSSRRGPSEPLAHCQDLTPGEPHQVAFLSIDIAKHGDLVRRHRDRFQETQRLINEFHLFVGEIARGHRGEVFSWAGDGGILIFWGHGHQERCILAGLHILQNLVLFNLSEERNPLDDPISVRMAANEALILFQLPTSSISSEDLNLTVKLQEQATNPSEFSITDTLRSGIGQRLAVLFRPKGRFSGKPVFGYAQPKERDQPDAQTLEAQVERVRHHRQVVATAVEKLAEDDGESVSVALDGFYSEIEDFCGRFESFDDRWATAYLAVLQAAAEELLASETDIWERLRAVQHSHPLLHQHVAVVIQVVSGKRARPVVFLESLRNRAVQAAKRSGAGTRTEAGEILRKIRSFLNADDLDQETALTDLLFNHRNELIRLLAHAKPSSDPKALTDRLWQHADVVLQDDLFSLHGNRREEWQSLSEVLARSPLSDQRFAAVRRLLQQSGIQENDLRREVLWRDPETPTGQDLETICRCLLIGHPHESTRQLCANTLSLNTAWQMIARSHLPLEPLHHIGLRIGRHESVEHQKIFFDCVRGRLDEESRAATTREEIARITRIMMTLIQLDYLVESMYFERFDQLLTSFLGAVERLGLQVHYFKRIRSQLEAEREKKGRPKGEVPRGLRRLPLTLQKRLAGEPHYLLWFIGHPDPRIALETERHIGLQQIERVLRVPEINQELLLALLGKRELFANPNALFAALSHPKCSSDFARQNLPRLTRTPAGQGRLSALIDSTTANSQIKALARAARSGARSTARREAS